MTHASHCLVNVDRECGYCTCGAEEQESLAAQLGAERSAHAETKQKYAVVCEIVQTVDKTNDGLREKLGAAEEKLRAAEEENARFDARRREVRQLLARFVRYEKGRKGPDSEERLAKLTAAVMDYLGRTAEPRDLFRAEEADAINPDDSTGLDPSKETP